MRAQPTTSFRIGPRSAARSGRWNRPPVRCSGRSCATCRNTWPPRVTFAAGTPPIVNPPGPTAWARAAVHAVLGPEGCVPLAGTNMGGEDFAFYLERIPGCFLRVGAREPGGAWLPAHSPMFHAAEE